MNNIEKEEELRQKFKVFVSEEKIIILVFFDVEMNTERSIDFTKLISRDVNNILNKDPKKKYHGIVDISAVKGKIANIPGSVRKIYADMMFHNQMKKIAIIGSGIFYEVVVNLIIQATGKKKGIRWFKTREEAIEWFNEKNGS